MNKVLLLAFFGAHALAIASGVPMVAKWTRNGRMKVTTEFDIQEAMPSWKVTFTFSSPIANIWSFRAKASRVSDTVWTLENQRKPLEAGTKFKLVSLLYLNADISKPTGTATIEAVAPPTPPPSGVSIGGQFLKAEVVLAVPCKLQGWTVNLRFSEAPLVLNTRQGIAGKLEDGRLYVLKNKMYNAAYEAGQVLRFRFLIKYAGTAPTMAASLNECQPTPTPDPEEGSGEVGTDGEDAMLRELAGDLEIMLQ